MSTIGYLFFLLSEVQFGLEYHQQVLGKIECELCCATCGFLLINVYIFKGERFHDGHTSNCTSQGCAWSCKI
jgi:hypothetical protein